MGRLLFIADRRLADHDAIRARAPQVLEFAPIQFHPQFIPRVHPLEDGGMIWQQFRADDHGGCVGVTCRHGVTSVI